MATRLWTLRGDTNNERLGVTMALEIRQDIGDRSLPAYPQVFCDQCWQRITRARDGIYAWVVERDGRLQVACEVFFVHKKCRAEWEQSIGVGTEPGLIVGAVGLECLPVYLAGNLQLDWRQARKKARVSGVVVAI
jgi:hypothetical protein